MSKSETALPVRLVINADDLGICTSVNEAIFDHIDRRLVSSSTLLANGAEVQSAAKTARTFSQTSFGVHLNATEFAPLTSNHDLAPILNEAKCFAGNIREVSMNSSLRTALIAEWIAQIEYIRSFGINVSHIDSHHHIHTSPHLFSVLKTVQRHCKIGKVRIAKNIYSAAMPPKSQLLPIFKTGWNFMLRRLRYPTTTTEGMTEFHTFLESRQRCAYSSVELMTHPGNAAYEEETRLLSTDWQAQLSFPTTIITYDQL